MNDKEAADFVRCYFESLFLDKEAETVSAFTEDPKPLEKPLTDTEVEQAIKRLKNN